MEVLGLCSYPIEAACTRFRLAQYVKPLAEKGINLTVKSFLNDKEFSSLYQTGKIFQNAVKMFNPLKNRFFDAFSFKKFDVILIQREAMIFGPPVFEWLAKSIGKRPLVLDLDDATYFSYISQTYGRFGSALKFFGKTDSLIEWSDTVICGNRFIAEYVKNKGRDAIIVPTVVNTDKFHPVERNCRQPLTIGWVGSHSTFFALELIFPALQNLAKKYDFILKIVGAGKDAIEVKGVKVENTKWSLEKEVKDFQSLDIGLYPLEASSWAPGEYINGKSGFKAIEYMSVGIPFVVTPVGVCSEIGVEGQTHYSASTHEQWYGALEALLQSVEKRKVMGKNGRNYALENYTVAQQTAKISSILTKVCKD